MLLAIMIVVQAAEHATTRPVAGDLASLEEWELLVGLASFWVIGSALTAITGKTIARHAAERQALDRSYRQLVEALPDGTFVFDWHEESFGALRQFNAAAYRMLGRERDEVLGLGPCDLLADCTPDLLSSLASAVARDGHIVIERKLLARDRRLPVQAEFHRFESAGRPAVLLIVKDLTDRHQAESAVRRRDAQLTKLSSATRRINEELLERDILRRLVESSMDVLGATEGMAGLYANGRIRYTEYSGLDGRLPIDLEFGSGEGVPGAVWDSFGVVRINDTRELPHNAEFDQTFQPIGVLAAPIIDGAGMLLGCVEVHDKANGERFSDYDGLVILGLAASAAIALENARILEELRGVRRELLDREGRLRRLAGELSRAEEKARRHIAEGLHDRIGQELAAMSMQLGRLRGLHADGPGLGAIADLRDLLDHAITETRELTFEISPPVLYTLGLAPALEWLCEQLEQQHGIAFTLRDDAPRAHISDDARALLYISVRELLMNTVKHARATAAAVRLTVVGEWLWVAVADDGIGFSAEEQDESQEGFGLFSIRERLHGIGGVMVIDSAPGKGTEVILEVPFEGQD